MTRQTERANAHATAFLYRLKACLIVKPCSAISASWAFRTSSNRSGVDSVISIPLWAVVTTVVIVLELFFECRRSGEIDLAPRGPCLIPHQLHSACPLVARYTIRLGMAECGVVSTYSSTLGLIGKHGGSDSFVKGRGTAHQGHLGGTPLLAIHRI
jgi:hypothetical protein